MGILDEAKSLVKLAQQLDNKELYAKILELQGDLISLYEENFTLRQRISEMELKAKERAEVSVERERYWRQANGKKDGPFCTRCYDADSKLIRLRDYGHTQHICPNCKSVAGLRCE